MSNTGRESLRDIMRRADAHFAKRQWMQAQQLYQSVLDTQPTHVNALCMLGVLAAQSSQNQRAAELFRHLVEIAPADAMARNNYANAILGLGRSTEALESYERALELDGNLAEAHLGRGVVLTKLGRHLEALQSFERALQLRRDFVQCYCNRGNVLIDLARPQEALQSYDQALHFQAQNPDAWYGRGVALERLWQFQRALKSYERALTLRQHHAEAWYGRGNALKNLGRLPEALASYDYALRLRPKYLDALSNRGQVLRRLRREEDAVRCLGSALDIDAGYPWLRGTWLHARMQIGEWQDLSADVTQALAEVGQEKSAVPPFALLALTDSAHLQQLAAKRLSTERVEPRDLPHSNPAFNAGTEAPSFDTGAAGGAKIRVAYLSADFSNHPVSYLMAGVLERHDRTKFEIVAASLRPPSADAYGLRVSQSVDQFVDLSQLSDIAAAQRLRSLNIDILVDLTGHTQGGRPRILAYRAAPIQINYLGFPGTLGATAVDYLIADEYLIPPHLRNRYSECIVQLPECFQANDDRRAWFLDYPPRAQLGLPAEAVVLSCFNSSYKITPQVFDIWMRLLQNFPSSVLWMAGDAIFERNMRREATLRGVSDERLVFGQRVGYEEHLKRLPRADLFLDTFPFNGGTTVSDALWMGLPVLSCSGEAMASRMGGSLLRAVNLPELACDNLEQYERLASELLDAPQRLMQLRERLRIQRPSSPLFNTSRFTRHLEKALQMIFERGRCGLAPQHLQVDALP